MTPAILDLTGRPLGGHPAGPAISHAGASRPHAPYSPPDVQHPGNLFGPLDLYGALGLAPAAVSASAPGPIRPSGQHPGDMIALACDVLMLIDSIRERARLPILRSDYQLDHSAFWLAEDMAARSYFSHDMPGGGAFYQREAVCGFRGQPTGEIIAFGFPDAASVIAGWRSSPPHWAQIMNPASNRFGCGVARAASGALIWACDFGALAA